MTDTRITAMAYQIWHLSNLPLQILLGAHLRQHLALGHYKLLVFMVADVCRLMISEYQALTPTSVVYYLASVSITCTMKTHAGYYAIVSENMNPIMVNLSDSEQYMSRIKWCIRFLSKTYWITQIVTKARLSWSKWRVQVWFLSKYLCIQWYGFIV